MYEELNGWPQRCALLRGSTLDNNYVKPVYNSSMYVTQADLEKFV